MMFKKTLIAAALLALSSLATTMAATTPATAAFNVQLKINSACTVSTTGDVDFGSVDANTTADLTKSATNISVKCSKNTAYTLGLKPSNGSLVGAGVMAGTSGNADVIAYKLYQEATYATIWGDTASSNRKAGTVDTVGNVAKTYTVFAKVLGSALNSTPDTYTDSVTVSIYY